MSDVLQPVLEVLEAQIALQRIVVKIQRPPAILLPYTQEAGIEPLAVKEAMLPMHNMHSNTAATNSDGSTPTVWRLKKLA